MSSKYMERPSTSIVNRQMQTKTPGDTTTHHMDRNLKVEKYQMLVKGTDQHCFLLYGEN